MLEHAKVARTIGDLVAAADGGFTGKAAEYWRMKRRNRADRRKMSRKQRERDATVKAVAQFYKEVAQSLDLPPRAVPVAAPPPPREARDEVLRAIHAEPARAARRALVLPALAVLLLVVVGAYNWWPAGKAAVPPDFLGTWVSRDPSYAGRMIVVSTETIEIVAGPSSATGPVAVTSSTVDTTEEGIRLRLVYGTSKLEQTLEMILHPGRPATLTLRRPANVVWRRVEGLPESPSGDAAVPNS